MDRLKAPFPYFGGKARVASIVWDRMGDVDNYVEPFAGSAAMLLARPHAPRVETVNDADCYVANFWRATATCPEEVAAWADSPVNEADLHARHRWLVLSHSAAEFRRRIRTEPGYFDARIAGWWCWGLCCWIGGGWCTEPSCKGEAMPFAARPTGNGKGGNQRGVHAKGLSPCRRPRIDAGSTTPMEPGVLRGPQGRPQLADAYSRGRGVHNDNHLSQQTPHISGPGQGTKYGDGIHGKGDTEVFGAPGTCEQRLAWLVGWFGRLRDRLRTVRVCCGDWLRVCDSESVTTRLGVTGVFLDPPYGDAAGRNMGLYATDSGTVAADVRRWCLERGGNKMMRIALAGYEGEGHEALEDAGWSVVAWRAQGGYGNRSEKGKANAGRERLWFSPHCHNSRTLFDGLAAPGPGGGPVP